MLYLRKPAVVPLDYPEVADEEPPRSMPRRRSEKFLSRLTGKVKRKNILVFDIESKEGETQKAGFTRPFMVGVFDGEEFIEFRNDSSIARGPNRHLIHGGCIDKFMRWLLRLDGCRDCFFRYTLQHHSKRGDPCQSCRAHREKYSSKKCSIFSHNGGRFDELFILGWLIKNRDTVRFEISAVQSRIQRLDVWPVGLSQAKLSWTFLDSFSILPLGLRQIGEDLLGGDLKTLPAVKDAESLASTKGKIDLNLHESDPAWHTYNKADCTVLYLALHRYHELIEKLGGEVGVTAPATSMKLFRRRYQKAPIPRNRHFKDCPGVCTRAKIRDDGSAIPCSSYCDLQCHGCAHDYIRLAYYGGRTEKYGDYHWDYQYFDINSSYPASMLEDMPCGDMTVFGPEKGWKVLHGMRGSHIGFVECEVEIPPECYIPPLPYRYQRKLVFPTGRFRGVWSFDELKLLEDPLVKGRVVQVFKSVWYKKAPIFREMVQKLYKYRLKHAEGCKTDPVTGKGTACDKPSCNPIYTKGMALIAKLMLNSLYGKFGMREDRTGVVMVGLDGVKPQDGWPLNGKHDSPFWEVERYVDAAYIIPQISAHITTLSRIRLWRGMAQVVSRGGRLFYVDTDSVKASIEIESSDELGGWKKEDPEHLLEGEWITNKLYRKAAHKKDGTCKGPGKCTGCAIIGHRHDCKDDRCKGCAVSEEKMKGVGYEKQTPELYQHMVHERGTIKGKRLSQHRTMINKGLLSPIMTEWSKSMKSEYDKRVMLANGDSIPLYILEDTMAGL